MKPNVKAMSSAGITALNLIRVLTAPASFLSVGINYNKMIIKGDKIKVKDNVVSELLKLGFDSGSAKSMSVFENTEQTAYDVYEDEGTTYVTVEMCCEIPIQCCEALEKKEA